MTEPLGDASPRAAAAADAPAEARGGGDADVDAAAAPPEPPPPRDGDAAAAAAGVALDDLDVRRPLAYRMPQPQDGCAAQHKHTSHADTRRFFHAQCAVCFKLLCEPATLRCGHAFCGACVRAVVAAEAPRPWRCPVCRAPTPAAEPPPATSLLLAALLEKCVLKYAFASGSETASSCAGLRLRRMPSAGWRSPPTRRPPPPPPPRARR